MKNFFLIAILSIFLISCTKDEKFNGSPVGRLVFENVTGVVSSNTLFALPGQDLEYQVALPQSFRSVVNDSVIVETTAFSIGGGVRKSNIILAPNQLSNSGKIVIGGGGGIFENNIKLKITGISLKKPVLGKQYTIDSNDLIVPSGNSLIPTENIKKMRVTVSWEDKNLPNDISCKLGRVGNIAITFKNLLPSTVVGGYKILINGVSCPAAFNTDLITSATNFVNANKSNPALVNANITLTTTPIPSSTILINYTGVKPNVPIPSNSATNFSATKFDEIDMLLSPTADIYKYFDLFNSELINKSNFKPLNEGANNGFNEGIYKIRIGVNNNSQLETVGSNLKYRIICRLPDNSVKIFTGVYDNISAVAGFKDVLSFKKTGFGDAVILDQFTQL